MSRIALLTLIGLAVSFVGRARADIAPPLPPAKEGVAVKIEVDEKAKGPRLVLPSGVYTPPRARRPQPNTPKAALDQDDGTAVADEGSTPQPRSRILIAGIALSMSLACGGLWLNRRGGKRSNRALALLIAAGAMLATGAVVWADAAPMPKEAPAAKPTEAYPTAYEGEVNVEFVRGQEPIRLILDKESYEKLKKGELKEAPK